MNDKRAVGRTGENSAYDYLIGKGYNVLYRNFRYGKYGEIDLIAQKAGTVCFIEVKSRSSDKFGTPAEAVGRAKQMKILNVANHFLSIFDLKEQKVRFDILEIYYKEAEHSGNSIQDSDRAIKEIRHIENAFGA